MAPSTTTSTSKIPTPNPPPTPLPDATRAALITHLCETSSVTLLHSTLQHSLARTGWSANVREYVLELLRSGEATDFPECLNRVMREATRVQGKGENGVNGALREGEAMDLRVPKQVVEAGVEFVRERIMDVVEVVEDGSDSSS